MRYLLFSLLFLTSGYCLSQSSYYDTLRTRLEQIKELKMYDNTVVINIIDSVDYQDLSYPYWSPNDILYEGDVARYKYCHYEALTETRGNRPDISRSQWELWKGPHPFLFLRDSANVKDLHILARDQHPYIKTYAFAALSYRGCGKLFPLILEALADTTGMHEASGDVLDNAYPADLMIEYETDRLSKIEKAKLGKLITSKYTYLRRGLRALTQR
jgi:hypothetical protein